MSVSIPSDLIAGVMKAAEPRRVKSATLRLASASAPAETAGPAFLRELLGAGQATGKATGDMVMDVMSAADPQRLATAEQRLQGLRTAGMPAATAAPDAYQKFEAFLLRSSFEEMLPPASSGAFGEGFAGGVWRSMAADQFASLFADHGGIGIASALRSGAHGRNAATAAASDPTPAPQWLYFQTPSIASFAA